MLRQDWERYKKAAKHYIGLPKGHYDFKDLPGEPVYELPDYAGTLKRVICLRHALLVRIGASDVNEYYCR